MTGVHITFCGLCRFQIVALPDGVDSDTNNGSWRIGDWADTLELPNIGYQAIVRWVPGPYDITGRGSDHNANTSKCTFTNLYSKNKKW